MDIRCIITFTRQFVYEKITVTTIIITSKVTSNWPVQYDHYHVVLLQTVNASPFQEPEIFIKNHFPFLKDL